ncbi:anhydro-N-acetylmuramic acid kinase [Rhodobacteraceae bacterium N5(2021)]|uniref:Anhydro-N-acetylmuramic acid kinase n=1 Tax=Gymnodinialimonas phycosphaerae TaxID=2841589 RepID=A0A975TW96_9RHOB|nr:anhydro-N-acetylmuramic acid kinase [Gymnodinialimonas phycosphaerae]MBY4891589.1 anhydro-N-acetylmuramic acid kinase [Gymnodinialimonas phycosphaerae]
MAGKEKRPGAKQGAVWAAGAMSGTSFDGVDVAVVCTDGLSITDFGEARSVAYSAADREVLRVAMGAWPGEARAEAAARVVEAAHIAALVDLPPVELLGFHGQTLAHDPAGLRTHQAGDGAALATALGVEVIWDFRSADMGMGGQGAPLAPFFHWACARWIGATGPVAFLNLGGVGNITWVDPSVEGPELPGACVAFDTGPANAPIDDLMAARGLGAFDADGALAAQGEIDLGVLEATLEGPWFDMVPPKSLDRDAFSGLLDAVAGLNDADAAATLTAVSAGAVARGLPYLPARPRQVLVAGGGRKNATMMGMLAEALGCKVCVVEEVGLNGDALEAQAFAYLAVRVARGLPTSAPGTTGVAAVVGGGRRSRPGVAAIP